MPVCRRRQCRPATTPTSFSRPCRRRAGIALRLWPLSPSPRAVRRCRTICHCAAYPGSGVHCELSIRACNQRSDHGRSAVFAVRPAAVAGSVAACERIFVHRGRCDRPCPELPGRIFSDWAFSIPARRQRPGSTRSGTADFRLSSLGYALLKNKDGGPKIQGSPGRALLGASSRCRRSIMRSHVDRDRQARYPADDVEWRALYVHLDRHVVGGAASQLRGATGACGSGGRIRCSTSG